MATNLITLLNADRQNIDLYLSEVSVDDFEEDLNHTFKEATTVVTNHDLLEAIKDLETNLITASLC